MPIKDQTNSYRIKNGIKFKCWADCCEFDTEERIPPAGNIESKELIKQLRAEGKKCFRENHKDYYRVFVEA